MTAVARPFFLAIEGPIGVGKTTLARLLQPRLESELVLEAFEENPFLSDFYSDRARYAFQTQMFFLLSRYRQQQAILSMAADEPVISDYTFGKDSLFARLNLDGEELKIYRRLYQVLAERIALPDLVVYLRAEVDTLMARIAARDRSYERRMDQDYIASVEAAYELHFSNYTGTPLLILDTGDLNYVRDASALAFVEARVKQALGIGAYQRSLPQMGRPRSAKVELAAAEGTQGSPGPDVLTAFLRANEAMARLGALLGGGTVGGPRAEAASVRAALDDTMERLEALAERTGAGGGEGAG